MLQPEDFGLRVCGILWLHLHYGVSRSIYVTKIEASEQQHASALRFIISEAMLCFENRARERYISTRL
jgi:hypothetical protein